MAWFATKSDAEQTCPIAGSGIKLPRLRDGQAWEFELSDGPNQRVLDARPDGVGGVDSSNALSANDFVDYQGLLAKLYHVVRSPQDASGSVWSYRVISASGNVLTLDATSGPPPNEVWVWAGQVGPGGGDGDGNWHYSIQPHWECAVWQTGNRYLIERVNWDGSSQTFELVLSHTCDACDPSRFPKIYDDTTPEGRAWPVTADVIAWDPPLPFIEPLPMDLMFVEPVAVTVGPDDIEDGCLYLKNISGAHCRVLPNGFYGSNVFRALVGVNDIASQLQLRCERFGDEWRSYVVASSIPSLSGLRLEYHGEVATGGVGPNNSVCGHCLHARRDSSNSWGGGWFCNKRKTASRASDFAGSSCWLLDCSEFAMGEPWGARMVDIIAQLRRSVHGCWLQATYGDPASWKFQCVGVPSLESLSTAFGYQTVPDFYGHAGKDFSDFIGFYGVWGDYTDADGNQWAPVIAGGVRYDDSNKSVGFLPLAGADAASPLGPDDSWSDDNDPTGAVREDGLRLWPKRLHASSSLKANLPAGVCEAVLRFEPRRIVLADGPLPASGSVKFYRTPGAVGQTSYQYAAQAFVPPREVGGKLYGAGFQIKGLDGWRSSDRNIAGGTIAAVRSIGKDARGHDCYEIEVANTLERAGVPVYVPGEAAQMMAVDFKMGNTCVGCHDRQKINNVLHKGQRAYWGSPLHMANAGDNIAIDGIAQRIIIEKALPFAGTAESFIYNAPQRTVESAMTLGCLYFGKDNLFSGAIDRRGWAHDKVRVRRRDGEDVIEIAETVSDERPRLGEIEEAAWWFDSATGFVYYNAYCWSQWLEVSFQEENGDWTAYAVDVASYPKMTLAANIADNVTPSVYLDVDGASVELHLYTLDPDHPRQRLIDEFTFVRDAGGNHLLVFSADAANRLVTVKYEDQSTLPDDWVPEFPGKPDGWDEYANKRDVLTVADPSGLLAGEWEGFVNRSFSVRRDTQVNLDPVRVWLGPSDVELYDNAAWECTDSVLSYDRAQGIFYVEQEWLEAKGIAPGSDVVFVVAANVANRRGDISARQWDDLCAQIAAVKTCSTDGGGGSSVSVRMEMYCEQKLQASTFVRNDALEWGWEPREWVWGIDWDFIFGQWRDGLEHPREALPRAYSSLALRTSPTACPYSNGVVPVAPWEVSEFVNRAALPVAASGAPYPIEQQVQSGEASQMALYDGTGNFAHIPLDPAAQFLGADHDIGNGVSIKSGEGGIGIALMSRRAAMNIGFGTGRWDARISALPDDAIIDDFKIIIRSSSVATWWESVYSRPAPEPSDFDETGNFTESYLENFTLTNEPTSVAAMRVEFYAQGYDELVIPIGFSLDSFPIDGKYHVVNAPELLRAILSVKATHPVRNLVMIPTFSGGEESTGITFEPHDLRPFLDRYSDVSGLSIVESATRVALVGMATARKLTFSGPNLFDIAFQGLTYHLPDRMKSIKLGYAYYPSGLIGE